MLLIIKGFIVGLGKIIPGVSGSLIAIRLNVYEDLVCSINHFFSNIKQNSIFLFKLCVGILLAVIIGSNIITYLLKFFYYPTMIIFLILILTGIPDILKKTNKYLIAFITIILYLSLMFLPKLNLFSSYYFMGFLEAFTTIIPGISGTALFMSFGIYDELLSLFSNIYTFNFSILIPFSIGLLIGGLIIMRFIDYCFNKYKNETYGVILGLLIGSIILMIFSVVTKNL